MQLRQKPNRGWSRDQRRAAVTVSHPHGHLTEIRLIAEVCRNLPGADQPRPAGEYDRLVHTWQTADDFQRSWLRKHFILRRLQLAAVPPRRQGRDAGLWARLIA